MGVKKKSGVTFPISRGAWKGDPLTLRSTKMSGGQQEGVPEGMRERATQQNATKHLPKKGENSRTTRDAGG
jgi:hypothetical protein